MDTPVILVSCCDDSNPLDLVKNISNHEDFEEGTVKLESIISYPWHISTKYYEADVQLCTTSQPTIGDQAFADSVEAIILSFNTKSYESYTSLKNWLPFITILDPEVRLLVCSRCKESDAVSGEIVLGWCIDNHFELIELDPIPDDEDTEEDLIYGMRRVVSALHAHTWTNLILKKQHSSNVSHEDTNENDCLTFDLLNDDLSIDIDIDNLRISSLPSSDSDNTFITKMTKNIENEERRALYNAERTHEDGQSSSEESGMKMLTKEEKMKKNEEKKNRDCHINDFLLDEASSLDVLCDNRYDDVEDFESVFEKLHSMKQHAEQLPSKERKNYAEKVAITFWKSIMGEDDEIDGLSHSSDEEDK